MRVVIALVLVMCALQCVTLSPAFGRELPTRQARMYAYPAQYQYGYRAGYRTRHYRGYRHHHHRRGAGIHITL